MGVNILAVIIATILSMVIGMVWYSPVLFGKIWMKGVGITQKDIEKSAKKGMAGTYILALINAFVGAYVLAFLLVQATSIAEGVLAAVLVWLGFSATTSLSQKLWEMKPWSVFFVNAGFSLVNVVVAALVILLL